jgi:hypothetical protein
MKRWGPHFSECEEFDGPLTKHCRRRTNDENRKIWEKMNVSISAIRDHIPSAFVAGTDKVDAHIGVFTDAFTTPGELAADIYHETVHWLDHYSVGRSLVLFEHFQGESLAYQRELSAHDTFELTTEQIDRLTSIQGRYADQSRVAGPDWGELKEHPEWMPTEALDIPEGAEPLSEGTVYENLSDIVNQAIHLTQKRTREQDRLARTAHPISPKAAPAEEHPAEKFERLARKACIGESPVTQEDVDEEFPDGTLPREYFQDCDRAGDHFATSHCERIVFFRACKLSGSPIPIDADTILSFAADQRAARLVPQPYAYPPQRLQPTNPSAPASAVTPDPSPDQKEDQDRPTREPAERHPRVPKPGSWNDH